MYVRINKWVLRLNLFLRTGGEWGPFAKRPVADDQKSVKMYNDNKIMYKHATLFSFTVKPC